MSGHTFEVSWGPAHIERFQEDNLNMAHRLWRHSGFSSHGKLDRQRGRDEQAGKGQTIRVEEEFPYQWSACLRLGRSALIT